MMIILNILVFAVFMRWFGKDYVNNNKNTLLRIVVFFLLASFFLFMFSFFAENEYLDGLGLLMTSGGSVFLFWICTTCIIVWKNVRNKTTQHTVADLSQVAPLLFIPILVWYLLSTATFKIGG